LLHDVGLEGPFLTVGVRFGVYWAATIWIALLVDGGLIAMATTTPEHDQRIAEMTFSSVYPHYVAKVEKKGRTKEELHEVIAWLTGFDDKAIAKQIADKVTFKEFFDRARLNANAHLITGVICGYRVEEIENALTQKVRYLDKVVDELAKGKKMEKILRGGSVIG
jgi:hypothetical protein